MSIFKVKNKNIDRQEAITGRDLSWMRYIKLYSTIGNKVYFPIGRFGSLLMKTKPLSFNFMYTGDDSIVPEGMQGMVEEQRMIMDEIDFDGRRTGLIEMKTGRGKGNLLIKIINHFQEKTLILCHNIKTLTELQKKFKDFSNYVPGVYYSKKKDIKEITITTHKSFVQKHAEFRGKFGILLVDEVDHGLSKDMIKAITFADCDGLFGLTGTPYRQDLSTEDMTLIFGSHIKVQNQANNGYNIIPEITRIMYKNETTYSFDDWHDMKTQLMHDKKRLDKQIEFIKEAHKKSCMGLILVDRVEECHLFHDRLIQEGIPCNIVNGETDVKYDEVNIQEIKDKKGIIVGTSQKVGRGVDIPEIDVIYLFYPCRFEGQVVQAVGRALRTTATKNSAILYDRCDIPVLKGQAYSRMSTYKQEYIGCKITTLDFNEKNDETKHETSGDNKGMTHIQDNGGKVIHQESLL